MANTYTRTTSVLSAALIFGGALLVSVGDIASAQIIISEPRAVTEPTSEPMSDPLPNWDPTWNGNYRPSLLSDEDCGWSQPVVDKHHFQEPYFGPQVPDRRTPSSPRMRTRSPEGRLHQAYAQSYRSQMPPLKEMHPDDFSHDSFSQSSERDLFGTHSPSEKQPQPLGSRGQWFGRYEALVAWPYYSNGHQGLTIQSGPLSISEPFDYNLIIGNRGVIGWESKKGPGGMFQYTDLFAVSERLSAGAVGAILGVEGGAVVPGLTDPFSIVAIPGERFESTAREHLTSYRPTAFKRVYFPVSTISGGFGFDYTVLRQSVSHSRFANLATTAPSETLDGRRRFSGIGPSFDIEYHRPIGHTKLAMLGGAQMGVLFGSDRWNVLQNGSTTYHESSHRVITNANVRIGVEWSQAIGSRPDSRVFARFTIEGQNWLNAGNFSSSDASLGFLSGNFAIGAAY